ncbi:hypothetical protein BASA81_006379 [Batrachochytrium salamandrivorans]|nr:hypothetical protein BASA81_006379 [Batrachochytrium salamandrivorans]
MFKRLLRSRNKTFPRPQASSVVVFAKGLKEPTVAFVFASLNSLLYKQVPMIKLEWAIHVDDLQWLGQPVLQRIYLIKRLFFPQLEVTLNLHGDLVFGKYWQHVLNVCDEFALQSSPSSTPAPVFQVRLGGLIPYEQIIRFEALGKNSTVQVKVLCNTPQELKCCKLAANSFPNVIVV